MHREKLVVALCRDKIIFRECQLRADNQGLYASDKQEKQGQSAVHYADLFMVYGGQPADENVFAVIRSKQTQLAAFGLKEGILIRMLCLRFGYRATHVNWLT